MFYTNKMPLNLPTDTEYAAQGRSVLYIEADISDLGSNMSRSREETCNSEFQSN